MARAVVRIVIGVVLGLVAAMGLPANAHGDIGVVAGYRWIDLDLEAAHDTHPDDRSLLPNSTASGSAGTTNLSSTHWLLLGGRYTRHVSRWSLHGEVGFLGGLGNRDERKNANDTRPDAQGAFIYSKANVGMLTAAGAAYELGRWSVGASAQLPIVFVEHGWDRFDRDERDELDVELVPTIGPVVAATWGRARVEATVQVGASIAAGVQAVVTF